MKIKYLIATAAIAIAALGAYAQSTFSGSMLYGFCTNTYAPITGFKSGTTVGAAIQLPESAIRYFSGCRITAIAVANGTPAAASTAESHPIDLFVRAALNEEPLQALTGEMDLTKPYEYTEYPLNEAIDITADMQPLFFGYSVACDPAVGNFIITDGNADPAVGPGDYIGILEKEGSWIWEQLRDFYGMPCIRLKIEGTALPANDVSIMESHLPTFATPGGEGLLGLYVSNDAGNVVESIRLTYTVNGGEEQTLGVTLPKPLLYNEHSANPLLVKLPVPDVEGNDLPVSINIVGVNAEATNNAPAASRERSTTYLSLSSGYQQNMVAEIATATWCGWCPRGIVGVTAMADAHKDDSRFIPIAAHYNDVLTVQSYDQFFGENYTNSATPSSMINRNKETFGTQDPSRSFLEAAFAEVTANPSLCSVDITGAVFDEKAKTITIDASAEFAIDVNGDYGLAYVITEDGVGPYDQSNNFSPSKGYGFKLDWWDEQTDPVSVTYNAIARNIYSFRGIKGSLPAEIKAGTPYAYSRAVQTNLVNDINKCNLIVMVVNRNSLRIENAVSVPYSKFSSINSAETAPADHTPEYFDLQGRRISSPAKGRLYIERRGSAVHKIIL